MANWMTPTPEQRAEWDAWLAERPACVRAVAEKLSPWTLYRLRSSGHRVRVFCFSEHDDDTVTVRVLVEHRWNPEGLLFERQVFGVDPSNLEECALPEALS